MSGYFYFSQIEKSWLTGTTDTEVTKTSLAKLSMVDEVPPKEIVPSTLKEKSSTMPPTEVSEETLSEVNPPAKKHSKS
uniref:Uncharacterized protein n=1 Tax=Cannabis sativa TaxID=3483 RepID=A0A803Q2V8_CANSA